ncbi:DNA mismatch endonuclease Vsr [candidate division KSB1 bacterium]|nr:DNA mismatch endonuclease Vsr [candidate division KSB1 bacterium]
MDNLSKCQRKYAMTQVKSTNTKAEIYVRSLLHQMGYRFRLHRADLPGKPDIVLPRYKTAIFVHGCFWHRHKNCNRAKMPRTNIEYWEKKFKKNVSRDRWIKNQLEFLGWNVMVIWECELKKKNELKEKLEEIRYVVDSFSYRKAADNKKMYIT